MEQVVHSGYGVVLLGDIQNMTEPVSGDSTLVGRLDQMTFRVPFHLQLFFLQFREAKHTLLQSNNVD